MRLDRQLARFLAAAIVMIAAYLAPSAVQAHAGHHHPAGVVAPEAVFIADGSAASSQSAAPSQSAASINLPKLTATAVVTAADADEPGPSQRCTGPCCCSSSMACCGLHALTADAGSRVRPGPAMRLVRAPDDLARSGVDPEALPKPPRTFA